MGKLFLNVGLLISKPNQKLLVVEKRIIKCYLHYCSLGIYSHTLIAGSSIQDLFILLSNLSYWILMNAYKCILISFYYPILQFDKLSNIIFWVSYYLVVYTYIISKLNFLIILTFLLICLWFILTPKINLCTLLSFYNFLYSR